MSQNKSKSAKRAASVESGNPGVPKRLRQSESATRSALSAKGSPSPSASSAGGSNVPPALVDDSDGTYDSDSIATEDVEIASNGTDFGSEDSLPALIASAGPQSSLAQLLQLQNRIAAGHLSEDHEPMHRWLETSSDPLSAPKIKYGADAAQRTAKIETLLKNVDAILPSRGVTDPAAAERRIADLQRFLADVDECVQH